MAITITIDGGDHSATARLETLVLVESAEGGQVGIGGFNRDDVALDDVPALKDVTVEEDEATPDLMLRGVTGVRGLERGPFKQSTNRQWDVSIWDINSWLDDEVFQSDGANRPAETDVARMTWLLTTSALTALGVTAGVLPSTNTVNMDAVDYRGSGPRRVADECAEASGKNYFLYDHGAGPLLYYDLHTGTSLSSGLRISSVLADVDNTTTFAAEFTPSLEKDPSRVYSKVRFQYDGGVEWVEDTGTSTAFRRREIALEDASVKTAAKAIAKATAYLDAVSTEVKRFRCSVSVPAAQVNAIRAGQRIEVKVPHLEVASFTWMRITRREVRAAQGVGDVSSERYTITLEFAEDFKLVNYGGRGPGGSPGVGTTLACFDVTEEDDGLPLCNTVSSSQDFSVAVGPEMAKIIIWRAYITAIQNIDIDWTNSGEVYKGIDSEYPWHEAYAGVYIHQDASWTDPDAPPTSEDLGTGSVIIQVGGNVWSTEGPLMGWRPFAGPDSATYPVTAGKWAVIYVTSERNCINVAHPDYAESPWMAATGLLWDFTIGMGSTYTCLTPTPAVIGRVCQGTVYGPVTLFPTAGVYTFPYPFVAGSLQVLVGGTWQVPINVDVAARTFELVDDPTPMIVQAYAQIPKDFQP